MGPIEIFRQPSELVYSATIIEVEGSSSAPLGNTAYFSSSGKHINGWIGGGCLHGEIRESINEFPKEPRTLELLLDESLEGVGIPCGGRVKVFVNPILPRKNLKPVRSRYFNKWKRLGEILEANLEISKDETNQSDSSFVKEVSEYFQSDELSSLSVMSREFIITEKSVSIVGENLIARKLEQLFTLCGYKVEIYSLKGGPSDFDFKPTAISAYDFRADTSVVILCSHHPHEMKLLESLHESPTQDYIGFVASQTRVTELCNLGSHFKCSNILSSPCGLNGFSKQPEEIALSILLEVERNFVGSGGA